MISFEDEINRLRADNARLRAEIEAISEERLTPQVFMALVEWLRDPKPAAMSFTAGIARQIAYALELDMIPEITRMRIRLAHYEAQL